MNSKTLRLAFPSSNLLKGLGQYTAFFTVPYEESKGDLGERYNAPGGRCMLLRPDDAGYTRAYLSIMSSKPEGYQKICVVEQKSMFRELFVDVGWDGARVSDGMDQADDFNMQEIAQIKMDRWYYGRVALIGDTISGLGTSLALIRAYVLAGELARCKGNWVRIYEERMTPFVKKAQSLPPGPPGIANPQSKWGISVLNAVTGFVSWSGLAYVVGKLSGPPAEDKSLPVYDF